MLRTLFAAVIVIVGFSAPAMSFIFYDDERSYAVWEKHMGAVIHIYARYDSRYGCARFVSQHNGPPSGQPYGARRVSGMIQMTLTVDDTARNCGGPTIVQKRIVASGEVTVDAVEIFFVSENGKLLKRERISIRG